MSAIYVERGPRGKWRSLPDADYLRLLAEQDGGCAICGAAPKTRRLHTDHDHRDGFVRGLLCHRCNRALPAWITPKWLFAAAAYLQRQALVGSDAPPTPEVLACPECGVPLELGHDCLAGAVAQPAERET